MLKCDEGEVMRVGAMAAAGGLIATRNIISLFTKKWEQKNCIKVYIHLPYRSGWLYRQVAPYLQLFERSETYYTSGIPCYVYLGHIWCWKWRTISVVKALTCQFLDRMGNPLHPVNGNKKLMRENKRQTMAHKFTRWSIYIYERAFFID